LQWALERPTNEMALRLESALFHFWEGHQRLGEGRTFLERALTSSQDVRYSDWIWWINRPALYRPTSGRFSVMKQFRQAFSSRSKAPFELFCGTFTHHPTT
jgi:hypothetical protein